MFRLLLMCSSLLLSCLPDVAPAQMTDGFESPVAPACVVPAGFTVVEKHWEDIFYGVAWPNSPSYVVPVGSWTYRDRYARYGKPAAGRLLTTSFVADGKMHRVSFLGAQPVSVAGYPLAQAALNSTVTISTCRADMFAGCQVTARSSSLYYGPNAAAPECRVVPGKTYWVTWHNAAQDFSPTTNSCNPTNPSGGVRCDANFSAY